MERGLVMNEELAINPETLKYILDYSTDEIYILDKNQKIVYVNKVCERHYGLSPSTLIGRNNNDLFKEGYWTPSMAPTVFEKKEPVHSIQNTYLGATLMTTAIPILKNNEVEYVIFTSQEIHHYRLMKSSTTLDQEDTADLPEQIPNIIANSPKMKRLLDFCHKISTVNSTVLIKGESGTGKSMLARYIHQISNRYQAPFMTISCAAIPEELLESELFGYEPGAFTGANKSGKKGLVELANGGTLFLDEVSEMPIHLQSKLLHVIQEKEFLPVGGERVKKVDIRIVAATNRDLERMIEEKKFREDLYYRLNVIEMIIPPLRERKEDITTLIHYFLYQFNHMYHLDAVITNESIQRLIQYDWPGNIRQLENIMERLVVTSDGIINTEDIPELIKQNSSTKQASDNFSNSLDAAVESVKRNMIRTSYQKYKSSRKVASDLKISQTKASKLIRQYCEDLRE